MPRTIDVDNQVEVETVIGGIIVNVEDTIRTAELRDAANEIIRDLEKWHAEYFTQARDPRGHRWRKLQPATIKRKGHATILVDTGELRASLTRNSAGAVRQFLKRGENVELNFGTSVPYAGYHQTGTKRMPKRNPIGISQEKAQSIAKRIADAIIGAVREKLR